ncbi:MAG: hypothetical protein Q9159_006038 [Coniocarpon cinnabarinum]
MAPEAVTETALPVRTKLQAPHPYAPLSADEIVNASTLLKTQWPEGTDIQYKTITLAEPPKLEVIPYLEAERAGKTVPSLGRKAFINYYLRKTTKLHEAVINLSEQKVESNVRLGKNVHGAGDAEEIMAMETIALEDEGVKQEIEKLKLPEGAVVVCDPWIYGSDGVNDDERMYQTFLYVRGLNYANEPNSNHYALPLPISPVISSETRKVIRIDWMPTGADNTIPQEPKPFKVVPDNEYIPEAQQLRTDVKPLNVVQPEGVSFRVTEQGSSHVLDWQKWHFRIGFNQREGMVLYNVSYDNRSLFHRLSLSDMNIPYADPRHPFHKKSAFDLGDAGAGLMANNLKLGCDCLGSIHYLSAVLSNDEGKPQDMPNVICIHEQDGGIGWKHTNYRTGRGVVTRNRELVLQTILTVANYEYILSFIFNQAAELHYEVRATGILSTQPIDEGVDVPFGTVVHPGVLATHHQHIFSLRIDPAIEGQNNRLVYSEAHPMPLDPVSNPHGNGYTTSDTLVSHSSGLDLDPASNRTFKILSASAPRNKINGAMSGFKLQIPPMQPMLSHASSFNHKRAEFADHSLYVTKYAERELYSGGWYTNQSRGGTGVRSWASRNDSVVDEDIVIWAQFGINHIPRVEDFPVMPCEILRVGLKPVNFFEKNPSIDVPPATQKVSRSVALNGAHQQEGAETSVLSSGRTDGVRNGATNGEGDGCGSCGMETLM